MKGIALKCMDKSTGQIWEAIIEWPSMDLHELYTVKEDGHREKVHLKSFAFDRKAFTILEVRVDPQGFSRHWAQEVSLYMKSLYDRTSPTLFSIKEAIMPSSSPHLDT